jgi:5'-3' exonuclease
LIVERGPARIAVADDADWRPQWRVEQLASYKEHRTVEPVPPGLVPQIPVIDGVLRAIGVDLIGVGGYEAEDVIATLAAQISGTVEIASGDRDLFALVEDPRVRVLYPEKSGVSVIDEAEITRRYEIPGRRYADFAILRGDPSDGLPGLRGVGAIGAAAMIRRYGDIAGVLRERELRPGPTPACPSLPPVESQNTHPRSLDRTATIMWNASGSLNRAKQDKRRAVQPSST